MEILLWSAITVFTALTMFTFVYGLLSGNLFTNEFAKISMFLLGGVIVILPITWAIYEASK